MSGGMYLAAAGALVQQLRLEVLANNVANISTNGYKGDRSIFRIPEETEPQTFETSIEGIQSLSPYAPPFCTVIDFSQGAIRQTGNPLDVAINGSGFFSISDTRFLKYFKLPMRSDFFPSNQDEYIRTAPNNRASMTVSRGILPFSNSAAVWISAELNPLTVHSRARYASRIAAIYALDPAVSASFLRT